MDSSNTGRATPIPFLVAVALAVPCLALAKVAGIDDPHPRAWAAAGYGLLLTALFVVGMIFWVRGATGIERPDRLDVRDGAFVAPPSASFGYAPAGQVLVGVLLLRNLVWSASRMGGDAAMARAIAAAVAVMWLAAVGILVAGLVRGRPAAVLTHGAVVLRGLLGTRTIPWPAVDAVRVTASRRRLVVGVAHPGEVTRQGLAGGPAHAPTLGQLRWVRVRPGFLRAAVLYYALNPDERAGIGTAEGHRRLLHTLRPVNPTGPVSTSDG